MLGQKVEFGIRTLGASANPIPLPDSCHAESQGRVVLRLQQAAAHFPYTPCLALDYIVYNTAKLWGSNVNFEQVQEKVFWGTRISWRYGISGIHHSQTEVLKFILLSKDTGGWGDGPVNKEHVAEAWGPEFTGVQSMVWWRVKSWNWEIKEKSWGFPGQPA